MLFINLCFVVALLLLVVNFVEGGDNMTQKLIPRCRENERRALMDFKAGVVDDFGILSSWGNNSNEEDCCNWRGIRCSKLTGYVTRVNIPGFYDSHAPNSNYLSWVGLSGKMSPSLSELKHLRYLDLSNNSFYGGVPPQLGNLTDLRSFVLGDFFGTMALEDLDWLSHLRLLTYLDLAHIILPKSSDWLNQINKLSSLTHLFLRACKLPESLPMNNASSLTSLSVVYWSFSQLASPSSYTWLFNLSSSLISIQLPQNFFFRGSVPEEFGSMMCLETLVLPDCGLEGMLPDSFRNLSRLTTLDLRRNNFNGSLSKFLHPLAAIKDNSLEVLRLNLNQLGQSLPNYLAKFQSLRTLSVSSNKLSGPFPDNFGQVSSLVHLDLSKNQITGTFPNLTLFSSLEILALDNNKLEGEIPAAYLSNLSNLSSLDLSDNSLSLNFSFHWLPPFKLDKVLLKNCTLGPNFPNWIKSQHNISVLDISHTRISDTIPLWFWDLSPRLKSLNMSNNRIKGIVPNISFAYSEIHWIDLSHNLLHGPIPPLPLNLGFLDLAHNMFTGSLSFVCKSPYTQLFYLDLSDNKISGELPTDCLMNIRALRTLNLANNDFSGNIPSSIGLQDQLYILQLRNNSFTGQLPLSLMNNTHLRLLDLSENKLSGKVPTWAGMHLTSLIVLSLRDNDFSGSIPPQICHLTNVQVLDLSQNNLTGSIPNCINNFTSLVERGTDGWKIKYSFSNDYGNDDSKYVDAVVQWKGVASAYEKTLQYLKLIDLSSNRLIGQIPVEFASLKDLVSLNLSGNSLTGYIIPKIGQMENLESLDLSRNHLSGKIPSSLASLTLLSVLDVSNNNLTGEIPSSTQLQSFDASTYAENEHLCGPPLSIKCGGVISLPTGQDDDYENNEERDVNFWKLGLYLSVVVGFATGFWGFIGPVMLQRTWRVSYYKLLDNITEWIHVTTILHITRLQRKFYS